MSEQITYGLMPVDQEIATRLGGWNVAFWGKKMPISADELAEAYLTAAKAPEGSLPKCFVAYVDGDLAGAIILEETELDKFAHLSPWHGSLIVKDEYQKLGIGRELALEAQRFAKKMGYTHIYSFTTYLKEWHLRWGWEVIDTSVFRGVPVDILKKSLHWDYLD